MNEDTRNTIESDEPAERASAGYGRESGGDAGISADRGMPSLGQYRGTRPRAWWLTPLVIILVAGVGAVWTIHTFLARHDAEAKARRDAVAERSTQGRVFKDAPVAASAASVPSVASSPATASAVVRPSVPVQHQVLARSYYDAPLLAAGSMRDVVGQGSVAEGASSVAASSSVRSAAIPGQGGTGTLTQALTPAATPRARAGMLGNRSLILAQGAKIDCAGDAAFDSTEAGLSTCTVTKNVYSDDGRVVLIERGSQINSQYRSNLSAGQKRTFVLSARVETPHGVTVEIDSPVADALGRMGIDGYVDNHWSERIGAALLLGLTQDAIGYLSTRGGNSNGSVVYENMQQKGNDMATRVLDSTINIPPTLTQNQGAEFTIVVARDLDFGPVYALQPERQP